MLNKLNGPSEKFFSPKDQKLAPFLRERISEIHKDIEAQKNQECIKLKMDCQQKLDEKDSKINLLSKIKQNAYSTIDRIATSILKEFIEQRHHISSEEEILAEYNSMIKEMEELVEKIPGNNSEDDEDFFAHFGNLTKIINKHLH